MMACTSSASRSLASNSLPTQWDVFLSFRGTDTRYTFTEFLYEALHRHGVRTFMDDPDLPSGDVISDALKQAIQESKTYVVVFSKNYASSRWCLDELVMIKSMGRLVIPVFYNIDPSVVRHQTGRFSEAFKKHETRFDADRLDNWRITLTNVGNFSGHRVCQKMSQIDIINKIVERVLLEINPTTLEVAKYPVGLDSRVKDITTLLSNDTEGVIKIGLHGMGGVGKTTLAKAVYNQNYHCFQGSCFLANVREVSVTEKGRVCLQQQLIDDILKCKNIHVHNVDRGIGLIRARICTRKVLIVIDDLDDPKQLEVLEGPFASGSIIIITTRNEDLLDSIKINVKYKVNELGDAESRQLFTQHAFGDNKISDTFTELSQKILERAGGLPLALKVFGSNLFNQSEEGWRWFIDKLKRVSLNDVGTKLVVSFDALKLVDPMLQDIFLDIACFFIGWEKAEVVKIMETCYTFVNHNIDILKKRSLLTINDEGQLGMHDLLLDMGKEIARNNYADEPEKHSRLWVSKDIWDVLKNHKGTEAIEGVYFDYRAAAEEVSFDTETFKRMSKLRFLYLRNVNLTGSYEQTFQDLRWLYWAYCPLKCLPSDFYPQKLVTLELPFSKLRRLWQLNMASQAFQKLKTLDMSSSVYLTTTPDFTKLPCLETLKLQGCKSLEEVHISIGSLERLVSLDLSYCVDLISLPDTICNLRALEILSIDNCRSLKALPIELGNIVSLKELYAAGPTVSKLPDSIGSLSKLLKLELNYNKNLETLPDTICNLRALEILSIRYCRSLKALPTELGNIESLKELRAEACFTVSTLPDSVGRLSKLVVLELRYNNLETLPDTICNLRSLEILDISGCKKLERYPDHLWKITSLKTLQVSYDTVLKKLPDIESSQIALSLQNLDLSDSVLTALPLGIGQLSNLEYLKLSDCGNLVSIEALPPNLKLIIMANCMSLCILPNLSNLKQLEELSLTNCRSLREIQGLEELTSIRTLGLEGCKSYHLAYNFTVHFFQIYSGFGREIRIFTSEFPDWVSASSNLGSTFSLELPPNVSHNFLAMILCFKHDKYCTVAYSVKNTTSDFILTQTVYGNYNGSLMIIVPRSVFPIRDGDTRIELTGKADIFGIHLLYKTNNTMIDEYDSTTINAEDERRYPFKGKALLCDDSPSFKKAKFHGAISSFKA